MTPPTAKEIFECAKVARKFVSDIDEDLDFIRGVYKQFLVDNLFLANELEEKLRESKMQTQKVEDNKLEGMPTKAIVNIGCDISELVDKYWKTRQAVIEWCNKNEAPKSEQRERQKMQMRYDLMGGKFNYLRAYKHIYTNQRTELAKTMRTNRAYAKFLLEYARGKARKYIKEYLKSKQCHFSLPKEVEFSAKKQIYATELRKDGWERYSTSNSGSLYYTKNRKRVRISDHAIKRFTDGDYSTVNSWNYQIII